MGFRSRTLCLLYSVFLCAAAALGWAQGADPAYSSTGVFTDVTAKLGLRFHYLSSHTQKKYLIETMGAGVALLDYDNDGLLDIFLVNGAPISDPTPKGSTPRKTSPEYWNRLYHQKKDGTFEDVTEKAGLQGVGYGMGVAVGDYDNDGYEDLYVTAVGGNKLYHNNKDGTFSDVTRSAGVAAEGWSTSSAWVDLDGDGLLDLIVLRYLKWDFDDIWCGEHKEGFRAYCHPDQFPPVTPLVFHNDGGGHFTEVSQKIGISKPGKGLGIAIADYDRDGHIDVFVANDSVPEFLYHNKGDGTFEEVGLATEVAVDDGGNTYAGMGVDFADYNNDGFPDLVVTNLANQKFALYQNTGHGDFLYVSNVSGIGRMTAMHSGWGIRFIDYDNDGWKDLLIAQGHVIDTIEQIFLNCLSSSPWRLPATQVTVSPMFQKIPDPCSTSRGLRAALAIGDIDNDGRLDAVVTTNDGSVYVLHNDCQTPNHWLSLNLVGKKSNRDGIGAEVEIVTAKGQQFATVSTASSYFPPATSGFTSDWDLKPLSCR